MARAPSNSPVADARSFRRHADPPRPKGGGLPRLALHRRLRRERCAFHGAHLNFCRNLRIDAKAIDCSEQAKAIAAYPGQGITQVYATRKAPELAKLVNLARDMQVTIVAERAR